MFAMGKLIVSASERNYVPSFFGDPEHENKEEESFHYRNYLRGWPKSAALVVMTLVQKTETLRWDHKVPVCVYSLGLRYSVEKSNDYSYALLLNVLLSSVYIIFGTFSFLLTFIGIITLKPGPCL